MGLIGSALDAKEFSLLSFSEGSVFTFVRVKFVKLVVGIFFLVYSRYLPTKLKKKVNQRNKFMTKYLLEYVHSIPTIKFVETYTLSSWLDNGTLSAS